MILTQFDPARHAVIDPDMIFDPIPGFPQTIVSVFSRELFDRLVELLGGEEITGTHDVDGHWPIYRVRYGGCEVAFVKARLGAPACVGLFEDVLALGGRRIILTGNCGVLDPAIRDLGLIVPRRAIRDEGTSYHYAPAADTIEVNREYAPLFESLCQEFGYPYVEGTTWTTDAFYRETPNKVKARREAGAITVEMECAAMQAMCDFRGVSFFQYLYAGDSLAAPEWEIRSLSGRAKLDEKERIALLGFELAARIESSCVTSRTSDTKST